MTALDDARAVAVGLRQFGANEVAEMVETLIAEHERQTDTLDYYKSLPHVSIYTRLERERDEARAAIEGIKETLDEATDERGITWWEWIEGGLGGTLHDDLRAILYPESAEVS